jgi:Trypsin-like peptidase domain
MAAMDNRPDFIVRRSRASIVHTARRISAGITLGLVLGAASAAHAGVPLPVVAETTGMPSLAAVVKRIAPSVVGIESRGRVAAESDTKRRQARKGVVLAAWHEIHMFGSGVVFDARRGLIITNSHVINHADDIKVKLTDGRELPARHVGADPETDVAVIQVRADGLTELPFGDSDRLEVGDFVFAVGNPLQIGQTAPRAPLAFSENILAHPAAFSSAICPVRSCSRVLTRAYPRSMASLSFAARYMRQNATINPWIFRIK